LSPTTEFLSTETKNYKLGKSTSVTSGIQGPSELIALNDKFDNKVELQVLHFYLFAITSQVAHEE
jgi:hypothetical protein